jgi:hypothetical protein
MSQVRERRRSQRIPLSGRGEIHVPLKLPVRVLDISLSGALVASDAPLPVGVRGRLLASAPGGPLATGFYVSRRPLATTAPGGTFGAAFENLDERNQKCLEQFLKRASE